MAFKKGQSGNPNGRPKVVLPDGRSLSDIAKEHTADAIAALVGVMQEGESEAARVSAANAILDRAWGRPKQELDVDMNVRGELADLLANRRQRVAEGRDGGQA